MDTIFFLFDFSLKITYSHSLTIFKALLHLIVYFTSVQVVEIAKKRISTILFFLSQICFVKSLRFDIFTFFYKLSKKNKRYKFQCLCFNAIVIVLFYLIRNIYCIHDNKIRAIYSIDLFIYEF